MTVDLADRLDLAPELRMACYSFREEFGHPPTVVWRVPGTVTLLASRPAGQATQTGPVSRPGSPSLPGPVSLPDPAALPGPCGWPDARLTVATPWGAIAVAVPRDDHALELLQMERPGDRAQLTLADVAGGEAPSWVGRGLDSARTGASLLVSTELPAGTGVGSTTAMETAVRYCLHGCATGAFGVTDVARAAGDTVPSAAIGTLRLPLDLAAAGLRLVVIDTRVRGAALPVHSEHSPLDVAATAIETGDLEVLGRLLTAAHRARPCNKAQDLAVTAALRTGALGARAIMDGPGRPAIALVPVDRLPAVRAEVASVFARYGLRVPRLLTFTPASGS